MLATTLSNTSWNNSNAFTLSPCSNSAWACSVFKCVADSAARSPDPPHDSLRCMSPDAWSSFWASAERPKPLLRSAVTALAVHFKSKLGSMFELCRDSVSLASVSSTSPSAALDWLLKRSQISAPVQLRRKLLSPSMVARRATAHATSSAGRWRRSTARGSRSASVMTCS